MKKFLAMCSVLVLFSLIVIPRTTVYSQGGAPVKGRFADDQILVKLKPGAEVGVDVDRMAEEFVQTPGVRGESLGLQRRGELQLVHLNQGISVEEAVQRANQDPRVEFAEPDYLVYATETVPNDPFFSQLWGLSPLSDFGSQTPN